MSLHFFFRYIGGHDGEQYSNVVRVKQGDLVPVAVGRGGTGTEDLIEVMSKYKYDNIKDISWNSSGYLSIEVRIPTAANREHIPTYALMLRDGMMVGEGGPSDVSYPESCYKGTWSDKKGYWKSGTCDNGASWLVARALMGSVEDYEFSVDIMSADSNDNGVVIRYIDSSNYIRFHHTDGDDIPAYNNGRQPPLQGCKNHGIFLVLRKNAKETCLMANYTLPSLSDHFAENLYHHYRVISMTSTGILKIYVDGILLINYTNAAIKGMAGSSGIWQVRVYSIFMYVMRER